MSKSSENMNRWKRLVSLCASSLVLVFVFSSLLSSVPLPSVVSTVSAASFSSITITDVTPTTFNPGDTSEVIVTVKNNGSRDAKNIRLAFQGTEIVSLVGPTVLYINTLNSWSSKDITVTMHVKEEAPNGIYPIPVICSWHEYYFDSQEGYVTGPEQTALLGLSFNVVGEGVLNVGDVTTDPTTIRPGDENVEIRVVIINEGDNLARNVEVILQLDDKFNTTYPGSNHSYIEILNANESCEAIFHINIADNIDPDIYSLPLQISFKDIEDHDFNITREITILVSPKPDFRIVGYTEPENIIIGDINVVLHVRVENIGSENVESVGLRITNKTKETFVFDERIVFLGNLSMGEEVEAIFNFDVSDNISANIYQLDIEVRCTGDRNIGDDDVYIFYRIINLEVFSIFDTGSLNASYPSISGIHKGSITPSCNLTVSKLYTYHCTGTGGHTEYAKISNQSWSVETLPWNGYVGDWHNLTFNKSFILYANETYNYTITTGSYPQIIHAQFHNATGGTITCTSFEDANGNVQTDWIPAIRLWSD
jgi:hypothetical protein